AKFTGSGLSSSLPASIFERSRISLIRLRRWLPAALTRRSGSSAFSVPKRAAFVTIISVRPMMALSGARSSWLMLARNCDLCSLDRHSLAVFDELGRVAVSLRKEEYPVLLPSYRGVVGAAKAASRFNERLQHRLEIEGRAADHLEHVGCRSLLLKRFAQLLGA